jgi:hypothetical protein
VADRVAGSVLDAGCCTGENALHCASLGRKVTGIDFLEGPSRRRASGGFYVLEGEITFTVNGERVVAKAGTFANMPVGTPHSFKNASSRPAKMLISVAPAGLERMFFEFGVPLPEGSTTAPPPAKEEIEKLLAVAPKYGIEIRLPQA